MKSCDNCTAELARNEAARSAVTPPYRFAFPLGEERGSQRDPEQVTLDLCGECQDCLGGRIGGPATSIDLDRFVERRLLALGHYTCREATRYAAELGDRGFRLTLTVAPDWTGVGTLMTWWSVHQGDDRHPSRDGVVPAVDVAEAIRAAYAAARGDGWPEERT